MADGKGGFSLRQLRVGSPLPGMAAVEVLAGLAAARPSPRSGARRSASAVRPLDAMGISGRIAALFQRTRSPPPALVLMLLGVFATLVTPKEEEPPDRRDDGRRDGGLPGAPAKDVEVGRPPGRAGAVAHRRHGPRVFGVAPGMAIITVQFKVG